MPRYSKSFVRVGDPYRLLALNVFVETFRNIESYYRGEGTIEERISGRDGERWIRQMRGNFRILASSTRYSIEEFHQFCIRKINQIRDEAYKSKKTLNK